jgi:hypothetical protein
MAVTWASPVSGFSARLTISTVCPSTPGAPSLRQAACRLRFASTLSQSRNHLVVGSPPSRHFCLFTVFSGGQTLAPLCPFGQRGTSSHMGLSPGFAQHSQARQSAWPNRAGRRHEVLPEVVIRSAAWQVEYFGSGCAGLRNMPASRIYANHGPVQAQPRRFFSVDPNTRRSRYRFPTG